MIATRDHRFYRLAVGERKRGNFRTYQKFFHDDLIARRAEFLTEHHFFQSVLRFFTRHADQYAFTKRQAVRL